MISNVAILGAGTMGTGIAIAALNAGNSVQLVDTEAASRERARNRIERHLDRLVEKGKVDAATAAARLSNLRLLGAQNELELTDLVVEAVFEDLQVKHQVLAGIEAFVPPDAVIATNTSSLDIDELGQVLDVKSRFLGLHFFSPAELNPVVETVRAEVTVDIFFERAVNWVRELGKTPIICRNRPGFAVNRFFCPYANEAVRCLEDGIGTTGQIDRSARTIFAAPLGPFAVMNITKPEILYRAQCSLAPMGAFYAPAEALRRQAEAGEPWTIETDPVELPEAQARQIADRLRGAVFFAAQGAIDEEVTSTSDLDLGAALALRFEETPFKQMETLGPIEVARLVSVVSGVQKEISE